MQNDSSKKTDKEDISRLRFELETCARELEAEDLSLEKGIEIYRRGMTVFGKLKSILSRDDGKIYLEKIDPDGAWTSESFDAV